MIALEEQNLVGMRVSDKGQALFFDAKTGQALKRIDLPVPAGTQVTSIGADQPGSPLVVLGLSNGQALVFHHAYKITYPDNKRRLPPASTTLRRAAIRARRAGPCVGARERQCQR